MEYFDDALCWSLCQLISDDLGFAAGVDEAFTSQFGEMLHLSILRHEHTVQFRREGHTLVYSIRDPRIKDLLGCVPRWFR